MAKENKAAADNVFGDYKKDTLTKPRDLAWSNWAKFEKVGDMAQGYIRDVFYRAAEGKFKEQRGITLEQTDGKMVNVGIKRLPFVLSQTDDLRIGDPLTVELIELKDPAEKGLSPTKIFGFYGKRIAIEGKTVAQLDAEDFAKGGSKPVVADGAATDPTDADVGF